MLDFSGNPYVDTDLLEDLVNLGRPKRDEQRNLELEYFCGLLQVINKHKFMRKRLFAESKKEER